MLVLTRKPGEQIVIAGNITISIVNVGPGRVKIGIDAPADVTIDRQEVHAKKADEAAVDIGVMPHTPSTTGSDTVTPAPMQTLHNRIKAHRDAARAQHGSKPLVDKPR
jgi:carbon storage regulator